jgi:MFS family permease
MDDEGNARPPVKEHEPPGEARADERVRDYLKDEAQKAELRAKKLRHYLTKNNKFAAISWIVVLLAYVAALLVTGICWLFLSPLLLAWTEQSPWHWIPAVFGFLCLLILFPVWAFWAANSLFRYITDITFDDSDVTRAQQAVRETEEDAINRLERVDDAGLLPLLRYSRAQLDAYYQIALRQAKGSYYNAVIAMWLGFLIILAGIYLYVGPLDVGPLHLTRPTGSFNTLILAGAVMIEFISALFLWVYRSTTGQQTYYYDLQMHNHVAILCFRMAQTMQEKRDDMKKEVIEKILSWTTRPERPPVVGARGLRALLPIPSSAIVGKSE